MLLAIRHRYNGSSCFQIKRLIRLVWRIREKCYGWCGFSYSIFHGNPELMANDEHIVS